MKALLVDKYGFEKEISLKQIVQKIYYPTILYGELIFEYDGIINKKNTFKQINKLDKI